MRLVVSVILACVLGLAAPVRAELTQGGIQSAPAAVELAGGAAAPDTVHLERTWHDGLCTSTLTNTGDKPCAVARVVLFRVEHALPADTALYGEGFTMLSQTGGTLGKPVDIGSYTDKSHYKIPQPADATTVYEVVQLTPPGGDTLLLGFTSCRRFVGRFHLRTTSIEVELDTENQTLAPGERWDLEQFTFLTGKDMNALYDRFAGDIEHNHPRLKFDPIPTGWCSWYCYGPMITQRAITANLEYVRQQQLPLKYIQIDDGYQAKMGDWLDTGPLFGGGVRDVLKGIHDAGYEPAIWVAPFVAQETSKVFQEHPDWFIQDDTGKPLRADKVTFGGWRLGPWYAIDGTHPGAQKHLEEVFRTMRQDWGCTYFKLDANFWGAMHGGHFHDPKATRVEAYRRGMEAVLRGAGDAFVLGCNHPLWPSLGVIHGARASGDVDRSWDNFRHLARENFSRNWENGRFWWNDPDCVLLTGKLGDDEYQFHASAIYACGGMTLSGDKLPELSPARLAMLKKLLPPTGIAARFEDNTFQVGWINVPGAPRLCLFNWADTPQTLNAKLPAPSRLTDFWTGADLGDASGVYTAKDMPPHSARVIICTPK